MKKTTLVISVGIAGALLLAMQASAAATFSFSPENISVKEGQNVTLNIAVDPHGVKNYTVKTELSYPTDLLEAKSFSFENGWLAVSRAGYDVMDNSNGLLIKTAGYPGGISGVTPFGSVSFIAKKSGNGAISVGSNSLVLDATSQNVLDSVQTKVLVAIAPATAMPVPESLPVPELISPEVAPTLAPSPEATTQTETPLVQPATSSTLLIAALSTLALGTGKIWVSILTLAVLAIIIILVIYFFARRKPRDNKQ
ncbi:MAG: cohesin domain-containing protein [Patescibacteria group bacterium]